MAGPFGQFPSEVFIDLLVSPFGSRSCQFPSLPGDLPFVRDLNMDVAKPTMLGRIEVFAVLNFARHGPTKKAPATASQIEKTLDRPETQELSKPAPMLVLEHESQPSAPTVVSLGTPPNPALTHLDAAISGLEKEVEMDKQDLTRLAARCRGSFRGNHLVTPAATSENLP